MGEKFDGACDGNGVRKKEQTMNKTETKLEWEKTAKEKFDTMITRIPLFHREIAKKVAVKRAELNALERRSNQVEESDIVRAFLSEVPKAFFSLMIRLFQEVGFDYKEYTLTASQK